jgi:hypothetical protein
MPPDLTKAHQSLDRAVDRLYRKKSFSSDTEELELLFERYWVLVASWPALSQLVEMVLGACVARRRTARAASRAPLDRVAFC